MYFDVGKGDEVEQSELPALEQLVAMGYEYKTQAELNKERKDYREVLLYGRIKDAIKRINPDLDDDGIREALEKISEQNFPYEWNIVDTNQKIYAKLTSLSRSAGGLEPITVTQYDQNGAYPKTVNLFDFENLEPENIKKNKNDFLVTNQFLLHGFKNDSIKPDIVIFVNGFPLVVIECKSPFLSEDPIELAVEKENFKKYQSRGLGYERLMFFNHFLVATCGEKARHGTILSSVNHYSRWSSAYPLEIDEVEEKYGQAREQEILIAGMLDKKNLLDLLKNFVVYEVVEGKKIKKVAKHQQFRAVTKCINRLGEATTRQGGVIWHTQGSGKSLTMQWFAFQAHRKFGTIPLVIVTDRRQLDKQIFDKFTATGFPNVTKAKTADKLDEFLANPKGNTIMTTIQKFTETKNITQEKILVLVDEAHRSQYGKDANAMDNAIPNGVFFAFTGTPIDREDKSTYRVFGKMLDQYGFEESKADGSTLEIRHVGKMPDLFIEGDETLESLFERIIGSDKTIDKAMKARLKKEYVTKTAIAESPSRIKRIARDIVDHYTQTIEKNGYKAMIVASSRETAVMYYDELVRLRAPMSKIVMELEKGEFGKDGKSWDDFYLTDSQIRHIEDTFVDSEDPVKILIVVDMLLVGFDAPIVQVMYLDKGLREHNLLQAIARVNRVYDQAKDHGLIVDYWGITKEIRTALKIFNEDDIRGATAPDDNQLEILKQRHLDLKSFLIGISLNDRDAIIERFEGADSRDKFEDAFKKFAKTLNSVMYKKETKDYIPELKKFSKVRNFIRLKYEGTLPSTKPYASLIQGIIDEAVRAKGILEIESEREITHENFLSFVKKHKSGRARTALIKGRATIIIREKFPTNPKYYEKLRQRLEDLIEEEKKRRKENAKWFDPEYERQLRELYEELNNEEKERQKLGFETPVEFAIYEELQSIKEDSELSKKITGQITELVLPHTEIIGWKDKTSIEKKMTESIYDVLSKNNFAQESISDIAMKLISLVKTNVD